MFVSFGSFSLFIWRLNLVLKDRQQLVIPVASEDRFVDAASLVGPEDYHYPKKPAPIWIYFVVMDSVEVRFVVVNGLVALLQNWHLLLAHHRRLCLEPMVIEYHCRLVASSGSDRMLGILNTNRKIRKRTDTDVAFTREYSRVSIFHRERECTN